MKTFYHFFGLGLAGALGTLARYGINLGSSRIFGDDYPWGTYIVNMLGCFLFGLATGLFLLEFVPGQWKVYVLTGFLGGFTTFSAFACENHTFLTSRQWSPLLVHLLGQNLFGIFAVFLGLYVVSLWK